MSMTLTRAPLHAIEMNGAGTTKRRSARLSLDDVGDEPPAKKSKANGAQSTTVSTKESDGDANGLAKRRPKKSYTEEVDGFAFKKGSRKVKEPKRPAVHNSVLDEQPAVAAAPQAPAKEEAPLPAAPSAPAASELEAVKPAAKKARRRFPTTPEREAAEKPIRRSKRLSTENTSSDPIPSPFRSAHAKSHANVERSPSPDKARPVTVEKKRKRGPNGAEEEEKVMRIALPFQDTPVIRRNKDMRKSTADGHRRSSSGMRGQRASSLIDDGRGNGTYRKALSAESGASGLTPMLAAASGASPTERVRSNSYTRLSNATFGSPTPPPSDSTSPARYEEPACTAIVPIIQDRFADELSPTAALPHAEVPAEEFYKHISADLTEPRRMRCLLGWCGIRALPPKPEAPKDSSQASNMEFQALQAGMHMLPTMLDCEARLMRSQRASSKKSSRKISSRRAYSATGSLETRQNHRRYHCGKRRTHEILRMPRRRRS